MKEVGAALIGGILSPAAIIIALVVFRDKWLDYFFAARLERIRADINQALETHKGEISQALESRKGEINQAIETLKGAISQALETHKATLERETRQLESAVKRSEEAYAAAIKMESTIDLNLRELRITAYGDLWRATSILPRWPRSQEVTYNRLRQFSVDMRSWYFEKGGVYLSERSVRAYSELQETIWQVLDSVKNENNFGQAIQGSAARDLSSHYDSIRLKCSKLRTSLTNDILSRRAAPESPEGAEVDR